MARREARAGTPAGTIGLVALVASAVLAAACSSPPPRVGLYGDSLGVESADAVRATLDGDARLDAVVQGGAALCDALPQIERDADRERHEVVLLQFTGNNVTDCMRGPDGRPLQGDALAAKYATDGETAVAALRDRGVEVVLVGSPVGARTTTPAQIDAAFSSIADAWAAKGGGVSYVDAGATVLAPDGTFTRTLPCAADEGPDRGCEDGRIVVRAPDGVHFCPIATTGAAPCPVYSSGARRFGTAMAQPVVDLLRSR